MSLQNDDFQFVLFGELFRSDKLYIKNITPVTPAIIEQYTKFNLNNLKTLVKETLSIKVSQSIIECFRGNNNELIEAIEEKIGYVINIDKDDGSKNELCLRVELNAKDKSKTIQIIEEFIQQAKTRLQNELFEYYVSNNVKAIIKKGLLVQCLILKNEYIKLNLVDINPSLDENQVSLLFSKFGDILDIKFNRSVSSRITGYVILSDPDKAKNAFLYFNSQSEKKFKLIPALSLDGISLKPFIPVLKAFWFLTAPTGKAVLTFKNKADLIQGKGYLVANSYRVSLDDTNPDIKVIVHNIDRNQDEISFENQLKSIISIEDCYFERQSVIIFLLILCNFHLP